MERIFTDERKNEKERNNSPWSVLSEGCFFYFTYSYFLI